MSMEYHQWSETSATLWLDREMEERGQKTTISTSKTFWLAFTLSTKTHQNSKYQPQEKKTWKKDTHIFTTPVPPELDFKCWCCLMCHNNYASICTQKKSKQLRAYLLYHVCWHPKPSQRSTGIWLRSLKSRCLQSLSNTCQQYLVSHKAQQSWSPSFKNTARDEGGRGGSDGAATFPMKNPKH